MKKLSLYLLLLMGLSVSTVGNTSTYYLNSLADQFLVADFSYLPPTKDVNGIFTDYWDFSLAAATNLGLGAGVETKTTNTRGFAREIGSLSLNLQKLIGTDWTNVANDVDATNNGVSFDTLTIGDYRLNVSGIGLGTFGAGRYTLTADTIAGNITYSGYAPTTVPTPQTWALLLVGGSILVGFQMRRKNAIQDSMLMVA